MSVILPAADKLARRVAAAYWGFTFERAVERFSELLATVPDYSSREITPADVEALSRLADHVVERIEERLERRHDRRAVQRRLAEAVYRIREHTESIASWNRRRLRSA